MKLLQEASEWIWRIVAANILWFLFTILGLGIFGFFPATVALFTLTRKWLRRELEVPLWGTFVKVYKQEFLRVNGLGFIFIGIGIFLYMDLRIVGNVMDGFLSLLLYVFIMALFIWLLLAVIYFFPLYVHFNMTWKQYIKQSFIISYVYPLTTIFILVGLFIIFYSIRTLMGLIPFISAVFPAYWITWITLNKFDQISGK
ncbi:YesL family protein [Longirhabdus pacifica]|uniref:YesL family protein n=1 Tax=Longirhabdus pacifica TaxID=2305227 RepID=UPI001008F50F|nr:YesL family protein [Longirhabdus pacifica]